MPTVEQRVTAFLGDEWQAGVRITTVPQALARLGLPDDDEMRWRIGQRLERAWRRRLGLRGLWRGLRSLRTADWRNVRAWLPALSRLPSLLAEAKDWNPAAYILSNDEKLIARHTLRAGHVPPREELVAVLGLERSIVETGLRLLTRLGFLAGEGGEYHLAPGHQRLLGGLGFNFHTVTLESGEQFNVP